MTKLKTLTAGFANLPARIKRLVGLAVVLPWLTACGHDAGYRITDFNFPQTTEVQFVNLMPDSPAMTTSVVDPVSGGIAQSANVEFARGSTQSSVVVGDYNLSVGYTDADGNQQYILDNQPVTYTDQDQFVYLFMGPLGAPTQNTVHFTDPFFTGGIAIGNVEVWFADGAAAPGQVDVYLTSPTTPIEATTPTATIASYGYTEPLTLTGRNSWRLRVTPHDSNTVLFDSGTFTLFDRSRTLFALTDYFGPSPAGTSPDAPLVNAVRISATGTQTFSSGTLPSKLRVINLIRDLPDVDVYFGSTSGTPMFDNVAQLQTTSYQFIDPGSYALNLTQHGIKDQFVLEKDLEFGSGAYYTLLLTGRSADGTLNSVTFATDPRPIVDRTKVNFINAGAVNNDVNLYLLDPGESTTGASPQVANAQANVLHTVTWHSGELDVDVTSADGKNVIVGPQRVVLDAGKTYTLVLVEDPVDQATATKLLILEDTAGG